MQVFAEGHCFLSTSTYFDLQATMIGASVVVGSLLLAVCMLPQDVMGFNMPRTLMRSSRSMAMSAESDAAAKSWETYFGGKRETKYQVIAGPALEDFAQSLVNLYPERFMLHQDRKSVV